MKKILIISLFLFGQQAFSEVIPSDQLTGIYKEQGAADTYIDNEVEGNLGAVNGLLCYLHSLRSEKFVGKGSYQVWTSGTVCDDGESNNKIILKTVVDVSKVDAKQIVKAKILISNDRGDFMIELNAIIRASATEANPLGDLTLNWKVTRIDIDSNGTQGTLEISNGKIEVIVKDGDHMLDSFASNVANKQGSFLTDRDNIQKTFAFNDDLIKTTATCFDRNEPTFTVRSYHIYTYAPDATLKTTKLMFDGIQPFAFSYKDDNDDLQYGYAHYDYVSLNGNRPDTIVSIGGDNKGTTYTVQYKNNKIDKLTTDGIEQSIAKPIEFDMSKITATDIRSNEMPSIAVGSFNSEHIKLVKPPTANNGGNSKILSLKDGAVLIGKNNNKKYIVKAKEITVDYKVKQLSDCNALTLPAYAPPSITYSAPDVEGLSAIDTINGISVIDGVIQ
ncbi:hypothetical protein MS2017_1656 [Bathymodiolus thermophilus thioautotrophic gill symbiont]|uniref:Uncharacterized protein n=1 Tax=Bathymodiolus thermophilus thioautotrophic gill symbiont TaxID=2360 RepID=A0A3G3IN88_9GAMM|nr:hypothetical protein [Bathymodiolus thermophilus thioautotrophic gill symbiont]AYQ57336.1 hypothetical protein MS2017_1656 [Bathymodiolus thermophilus thioautotrophic gill symbiont]